MKNGGRSCEAQANQQAAQVEGGAGGSGGAGLAGQTGQVVAAGFLAELLGAVLGEVQVGVEIHGGLRVKPLPLWHPCSALSRIPMVRCYPPDAHARGGAVATEPGGVSAVRRMAVERERRHKS